MARQSKPAIADSAQTPRAFPPRWLVLALTAIAIPLVIAAIAGSKTSDVLATFIYAAFTLPLTATAGMLGLAITEPFARRGLFDASPWPRGWQLVTAFALGFGALALGALVLGTLHLIEPAGNPWPLLALPLAALFAGFPATKRFLLRATRAPLIAKAHRGEWLFLLAAVPIAVLLIAATFPPGTLWGSQGPGTLWDSEAHGYDVLEYHLQLPREYALNNSTAPLAHNVYSYLPANVEMLYLLLTQFAKGLMGADRADGYVWGAFPAQFCHVLLTLLTAAAIGLMPLGWKRRPAPAAEGSPPPAPDAAAELPWLGPTGRALAILLFLGIPYTLITGSLAYNESGMMLFGTLALGLTLDRTRPATLPATDRPRALLIGLLLGLAVGCKMTAGVFFALPVAAIYLARAATDSAQLRHLLVAAAIALAAYAPWALRAAIYSGGNPVFPLAANLLPRDGWTDVETDRFNRGHSAPESLRSPAARLWALVDQSVLDENWSLQPLRVIDKLMSAPENDHAPAPPPDPWWKRLGLLWLALPLAIAAAFITRPGRGDAALLLVVLAVQLLAWLFTTQLESRFLLPAAVPLALLAGRGVQGSHRAREAIPIAALRIIAGTIIALHALAAGLILSAQSSLLGGVLLPSKDHVPDPPVGELFSHIINLPAQIEHASDPAHLPAEKILLVGQACPWLYSGDVAYCTVFDRSPFYQTLSDPAQALIWLRARHIQYVLIDWSEINRLRRTYGFDPAVTPDSITALVKAGAVPIPLEAASSLTILRIPP